MNNEYPYLYETHLHTNVSSACAISSPEEMAVACKDYGYTGIIVTDHNWGGNTSVDKNLPWEEFIDNYFLSYERAKKKGDEIGLQVFFGIEAGFDATEFLIYGLTKDYLKAHPEYRTSTVEEQFEIVHNGGGIIIHAHPYREAYYIPKIRLFPDYIDGVEGVNATHVSKLSKSGNNAAYDEKAREYAKKLGLPMTAGSDIHSTTLFGGGIRTKKKLRDINEFTKLILSGKDYILWDGEKGYQPM